MSRISSAGYQFARDIITAGDMANGGAVSEDQRPSRPAEDSNGDRVPGSHDGIRHSQRQGHYQKRADAIRGREYRAISEAVRQALVGAVTTSGVGRSAGRMFKPV